MKIKTCLCWIVFIGAFSFEAHAQWSTATNGNDIYYSAGRVGIGTSSPTGRVSVYYTGTIAGGDFTQASFYTTNGSQQLGIDPNQIYTNSELVISSSSGHIRMQTGGVNRVYVGTTGRVGIGNDAVDMSGTALDQFVVGDGNSSQGVVVYHGSTSDAGYAFANSSGAISARLLYKSSGDYVSLQHGGSDKVNVYSNLVDIIPNVEMDGRLFFGDYTNQDVGTIQIKKQGANDGITLWTQSSGIVTKRIWIDDASNTLQLTAGSNLNQGLSINESGNIGIGTSDQTYKLEVNGTIRTKEVIVEATSWPDYVFEEEYGLRPLNEVENYINKYGHLPDIASEEEVMQEGQHLGDTQQKLLQKIEELTLYVIELKKENEAQQRQIDALKKDS